MSDKIIRLRKVSWKSKNNVYGYILKNNEILIDYENILDELGSIDVLIIPLSFEKYILPLINTLKVDNIYYVSTDYINKKSNFVCKNDSQEVVDYISVIDNINISLESGACAKFAVDLGIKYYWKNILIFLF